MRPERKKILFVSSVVAAIFPKIVWAANAVEKVTNSLNEAAPKAGYDTNQQFLPTVGTIINSTLNILGVFFMILIIYGGNTWMNAKGNEEQIGKAKKIISAATIGFIAAVVSRTFTEIIIRNLVGPVI